MSRRNTIKLLLVVCCIFVVNTTVFIKAYLYDGDTATNTLTYGKLEIELTEPSWDQEKAFNLVPNETIPKDPTVTNISNVNAYVGISVEGIKRLTDANYIIGILNSNGNGLQNRYDEVVCWNTSFTLVTRNGNPLPEGLDNALTKEELAGICAAQQSADAKLYFAYNDVLPVGESTPALFSGIKNANSEDGFGVVSIIKYFTKDDGSILYTSAEEAKFDSGKPATDVHGDYIYKYKISAGGVEEETVYDTYEDAKYAADEMIMEIEDYYTLIMHSAAIQATNDALKENWTDTTVWYPQLSEEF